MFVALYVCELLVFVFVPVCCWIYYNFRKGMYTLALNTTDGYNLDDGLLHLMRVVHKFHSMTRPPL